MRFYALDRYEQIDLLAYDHWRSRQIEEVFEAIRKQTKESMAPEILPFMRAMMELM